MTTPDALPDLRTAVGYAVHQAINAVPPMHVINTEYVPQAKRRPNAVVDRHAVIVATRDTIKALIPEGAVLVTEEGLAAALAEQEGESGLTPYYWRKQAAAILARLRDTPVEDTP